MEPEDMRLFSHKPATLTYSVAGKSAKHYDVYFLILSSQTWSSQDTLTPVSTLTLPTRLSCLLRVFTHLAVTIRIVLIILTVTIILIVLIILTDTIRIVLIILKVTILIVLIILTVTILIVLIILTSRGVSHNPAAMFYVAYYLTLKKELRFDCFVCKVRDQAEETIEL
jgi:hypothetical protein